MESYGLYYSYSQSWTHRSKGYLVHGPYLQRCTCLDIRKCTKFKRLSDYLTRCAQWTDFSLMEAYDLYNIYNQSWTDGSEEYLVHGPYFLSSYFTCLDIQKYTKFKQLSRYLICCVQRTDFHLGKPMVCAISTPNLGPIVQRATWYMDHTSHDTLV